MPKRSNEVRKGGTPPRDVLYSEAAKYCPRAIEVLVAIMEHGDNDNARMGAAKAILAKAIPDLKATDLSVNMSQPSKIYIMGGGFMPPNPSIQLQKDEKTPLDKSKSLRLQ